MSFNPPPLAGDTLRARWWNLASGSGWSAESEWRLSAVDALCDALADERDPWAAAERLGYERAAASIPLAEALADIDLLATLVVPSLGETLRRAVALGWSAKASTPPIGIIDPLTGLASLGYLQVRIAEIYKAIDAGLLELDDVGLVLIRLESVKLGLSRNLPMVLLAESLRGVFDAGESLALVSEMTVAVLCRRDADLPRRVELGRTLAQRVIDTDQQAGGALVRAWLEQLPGSVSLAHQLLESLAR